jgi:hypothetical protein
VVLIARNFFIEQKYLKIRNDDIKILMLTNINKILTARRGYSKERNYLIS